MIARLLNENYCVFTDIIIFSVMIMLNKNYVSVGCWDLDFAIIVMETGLELNVTNVKMDSLEVSVPVSWHKKHFENKNNLQNLRTGNMNTVFNIEKNYYFGDSYDTTFVFRDRKDIHW